MSHKFFSILSLAAIVLIATGNAAIAVEYGNLSNLNPSYGTWPGESTANFSVDSAGSFVGSYAIQIGPSAADDYAGGVLIPSVSQNLRNGLAYTPSVGVNPSGQYSIVTAEAQQETPTLGDIDVAAAYFPFAENWVAGYTYRQDGATSGTMDTLVASGGLQMGTHYYDNGSGVNQVWIPGVNPFTDGILLAANMSAGGTGSADGQLFAMTQANYDGSFNVANHPNDRNSVNHYTSPSGFVFVPYGTPGVIAGRVTGSGGIANGDSGFSVVPTTTDGVVKLTIDGYSPSQGTLIVTPAGGRSSTDDDIVTYEASGNDFLITKRDLSGAGGTVPTESFAWGRDSFSFAFLPFDQQITAPGSRTRVDHTAQVSAANVAVTEYGSGNTSASMLSTITQSTPRMTMLSMNRGDNALAIDGNHARFQDGVMMTTVREDFRDNFATGGVSGVGLACPFAPSNGGPDGWGYEISTTVADDASNGEMNVNFATSYFPFKQGWAGGVAHPTENASGQDVLEVNTPGVNSSTDGLLFVNAFGNTDAYAAASSKANGSGWDVSFYDVGGILRESKTAQYNYLYLPYGEEGAKNTIMGSVNAAGTVQSSQGSGFTITPENDPYAPGKYRLSITGKTPDDGMLLLTATSGGTANGNAFMIYERDGDDFVIHGYQGVYNDPAAPAPAEAIAIDTGFNFAFVDFENLPELGTAAVNPFGKTPVAVGSWAVETQSGDNTAPLITQLGSSDAKFGLWQEDSSRGDLRVKYGNGNLSAAKGFLFTQVCENKRDNSAFIMNTTEGTMGENSWGIANPNTASAGYEIATNSSNPSPTHGEFDVNVAAAYFPYDGDFQAGFQPILDGVYQLRLPDSGDTRKDGVLLATAMGNDDNFASAGATTDGLGWIVRNRDNSSGYEADDFGYVYLPYGTENLTAGHINKDGSRKSWTGDFHIEQVYEVDGTPTQGVYRLTVKDESPDTGVLLLTASEWNYANDNLLTYEADGNSFLINGLDSDANRDVVLSDTEFSFAFIPYDSPIANPSLRAALDPTKCSAGNIASVQYSPDNNSRAVTMYMEYDPVTFKRQATERFANSWSDKGDFRVTTDGEITSTGKGIMMATVRVNGHDNGDGDGTVWGIAGLGTINTDTERKTWYTNGRMGAGGEFNSPVATATFDYDGNWAGAYVEGDDGSIFTSGLGDYTVAKSATGQYTLSIDGVDTNSDGLLFTIAATNGNETLAIDALADGSGWNLGMYDGELGNLGTYVDGDFGFLYLPFGAFEGYEIDNLLAAEIAADGSVLMSEGNFSLSREAAGTYRLAVTGETPETGMLLLSANGLEDNILSYEADGNDFLIMSNDLGNGVAGLLEDVGFNFAFIGFDNPMQVIESSVVEPLPGDANEDGAVDVTDLGLLATYYGTPTGMEWEHGDFTGDGAVDVSDLGILATNYGTVASGAVSVPEPSILASLIGLIVVVAVRTRRRR